MGTLIIVLTYFAYIFIVAVYTVKVIAWLKMPPHIRWDLYPVIHEENYRYGGSYYEHQEWWTKPRPKNTLRSLLYPLKIISIWVSILSVTVSTGSSFCRGI